MIITLYRATIQRSLDNKRPRGRTLNTSDNHEDLIFCYASENPLCIYNDLERETAFYYSNSKFEEDITQTRDY
jgi:hypothetical protein